MKTRVLAVRGSFIIKREIKSQLTASLVASFCAPLDLLLLREELRLPLCRTGLWTAGSFNLFRHAAYDNIGLGVLIRKDAQTLTNELDHVRHSFRESRVVQSVLDSRRSKSLDVPVVHSQFTTKGRVRTETWKGWCQEGVIRFAGGRKPCMNWKRGLSNPVAEQLNGVSRANDAEADRRAGCAVKLCRAEESDTSLRVLALSLFGEKELRFWHMPRMEAGLRLVD